MALAQKIAYYREKRGFSQRELAEKIGVSQSAVAHYEVGSNKPRIETLFRIAQALGVEISDLFAT